MMIVMVFEFNVRPEEREAYLDETAKLRLHLPKVDGFISVERFESASTPGRFVAVGYFENEEAVAYWRKMAAHRKAQTLGRDRFFSGYRLVMATSLRDYTHHLRNDAPDDSKLHHGG